MLYGSDLLGIENLSNKEIELVLKTAERYFDRGGVVKENILEGKIIVNLFFEPSTRTRTSFEIAAKKLSADVINFDADSSSLTKGETVLDTAKVIAAMKPDIMVVRHKTTGIPEQIAKAVLVPVINAGDGVHEHPSQALLDMFTVQRIKHRFDNLKIAIVGDVVHSRVARSDIYGFKKMGAEVRVAGPSYMLPAGEEFLGAKIYPSLEEAIDGVDIIIALRIQKERLSESERGGISSEGYSKTFGIDREKLRYAKQRVLVMHPGPVNRGIELSHDVVDNYPNVILDQARNGVFVRMAILRLIAGY